MCCFSIPVEDVGGTRVFVRGSGAGRQFLVYSMEIAALSAAKAAAGWLRTKLTGDPGQLAMVLPLPVPPRSPENAVRFISLEKYPDFFDDLESAFAPAFAVMPAAASRGGPSVAMPKLVVHKVGGFDASFVPTLADFDRLDERFRLPPEVWAELPRYGDYGFAVFKLRADTRTTIHPMAFEFPRRDPEALFVPTVHVHDARVHPLANFDHRIYFQVDAVPGNGSLPGFENSERPAGTFVNVQLSSGIIDGAARCYRQVLRGPLRNTDVRVLRIANGLAGMRLEGKLADATYDGHVYRLANALISELLLNRAIDIDALRPRPERGFMLPTEWRKLSAVEITRLRNEQAATQRKQTERALIELHALMKNDIEEAREIFSGRVPSRFQNETTHFGQTVERKLRSALDGSLEWI